MKISVRVRIDDRDLERDYCYTKEDIYNGVCTSSIQVLVEDTLKYSEERPNYCDEDGGNEPF